MFWISGCSPKNGKWKWEYSRKELHRKEICDFECAAIDAGEHQKLSLLGIAMKAAFNSKATLNRVFKEIVGFTPHQYSVKDSGLQHNSRSSKCLSFYKNT